MAVPTTWTTAQGPLPTMEEAERTEVAVPPQGSPLPAKTPGKYKLEEKCSIEGLFNAIQVAWFHTTLGVTMYM